MTLDDLIRAAHKAETLRQQEQAREQQEQARIAALQREATLRRMLSASSEALASLEWRCVVHPSGEVSLALSYEEADWHLVSSFLGPDYDWAVWTTDPGDTFSQSGRALGRHIAPQDLEQKFPLLVDAEIRRRANEKRSQAQLAEARERALVQAQENQLEAARKAQEADEAREAEHEKWEAALNKAVREAQEALWRWPEGVHLTLFRVRWCRGAYWDEGTETLRFDYATGYTLQPALDAASKLPLEPAGEQSWNGTVPKTIRLLPEVHKPVWEEIVCAATSDLPDALREEVLVTLPGVMWIEPSAWDPFLSEEEEQERYLASRENGDPDRWAKQKAGEVPLQWIRDLVEITARR